MSQGRFQLRRHLVVRPLAALLVVVLAATAVPPDGLATVPSVQAVTDATQGATTVTYDANGNMLSKVSDDESLTLAFDAENRLVAAQRQGSASQNATLTLNPGWNFVSLPVDPADDTIATVLSAINGSYSQVSRYNPATDKFEHYVGNSTFDNFTAFELGRGDQLYITAPSAVTLSLVGAPPAVSVALAVNTNLIGPPITTQTTVADALADLTLSLDYDTVWRYTGSSFTTLSPSTLLQPGEAVYLHMLHPATWNPPTPVIATAMTYDGDGGRVQVTSGGSTTVYLGQAVEITGGILTKHLYFGNQRIGAITSGTPTYVHADHLGSANRQTNSAGTSTAEYTYTPFGALVTQSPAPTGSPHLYTGQRFDAGTGLYYLGARYYDPELGRFITPDDVVPSPSGAHGLNRYSYAYNNPVNYVDPDGHFPWLAFAIGALIGGVSSGVQSYQATGKISWAGVALNALAGGLSGAALSSATTAASLHIGVVNSIGDFPQQLRLVLAFVDG